MRRPKASDRIFFALFLPLGAAANLALGLVVLAGMISDGEFTWLQLATGAFCCVVAGWLAAAAWSRFYWNRSLANHVAVWRKITDAFFTWLEEAPLPVEAVQRLKSSLEEVMPTPASR